MSMYYSKTTGGFYDSDIHDVMPPDVVEISDDEHQRLINGNSAGKIISSDDSGKPVLIEPLPPSNDRLSSMVRSKRDALISVTDYLVMPDYPIAADLLAKVKVYRQALRDVTDQDGFPVEIDWPVNPMDEVTV